MNCNTHAPHEVEKKLPWAKRIRCSVPVTPQIFIISSRKDSRQTGVLRRKRQRGLGGVGVSDWEMLCAYKRRRLASGKTVDGRKKKNGRLCGVMPWRAVKSSLQGWSKLSSSANPSVPVLSSPAIHPFTHLYLCLSDEDKGKHSLTRSLAFWLHGAHPSSLLTSLPPSSLLLSVSSGETCRPD